VREQAAPVLTVALASGALALPAAVMGGGAGLELLHPFAIALLGGLVTSVVVVLVVVPGLYPALAGLEPVPIPPDIVDVEAVDVQPVGVKPVAAGRRSPPDVPEPRPAHGRLEREEQS